LNKGRVHFVIVFNLTRFARDKYDHFALRSHLQSLGISLRSATEPIDWQVDGGRARRVRTIRQRLSLGSQPAAVCEPLWNSDAGRSLRRSVT
jgi:DNA invertase Pin-like site-specific DNA recombinase